MTQLSVNVNKLATLRNARGGNNPDLVQMALDIIAFGAQGITVHPRPDERHIRKQDVYDIAEAIDVEFNIEGYPGKDFLQLVKEVKPAQVTLVPDPPHVLTSNAGWEIQKNASLLKDVTKELQAHGSRVSLFVDPFTLDDTELASLQTTGANRVELYTEAYAHSRGTPQQNDTLSTYRQACLAVKELGLGVNAGHDLDLTNLAEFVRSIPLIDEVSIGHALVCDALYLGMEETVKQYLICLSHTCQAKS